MPKCDFISKCGFIEITLWHGYSPINLVHICRTPVSKNTSGGLLLSSPKYDSGNKSQTLTGNG